MIQMAADSEGKVHGLMPMVIIFTQVISAFMHIGLQMYIHFHLMTREQHQRMTQPLFMKNENGFLQTRLHQHIK